MNKGPDPRFYGVLLAAAVLFGLGINALAHIRVEAGASSVADCRKEIASAHSLPLILRDSQTKLDEVRNQLKHLEDGLPNIEYVPTMVKQLETLGNECGIHVTEVRPTPKNEADRKKEAKEGAKNPYETIDIQVKGIGHYGDALRFVRSLNQFPKVVSAQTVSLEPKKTAAKEPPGSPELTLSITLRAYLFKAQSVAVATTASVSSVSGNSISGGNGAAGTTPGPGGASAKALAGQGVSAPSIQGAQGSPSAESIHTSPNSVGMNESHASRIEFPGQPTAPAAVKQPVNSHLNVAHPQNVRTGSVRTGTSSEAITKTNGVHNG